MLLVARKAVRGRAHAGVLSCDSPRKDGICHSWSGAQWRCPPNVMSNYPKAGLSVGGGAQGMVTTLSVILLMSVSLLILLGPFALAHTTWLLSQG
mgnify:CR=1 FL=1